MANVVMYCLGCRAKKECEVVEESVTKNNRRITKGVCLECGRKCNVINGLAS